MTRTGAFRLQESILRELTSALALFVIRINGVCWKKVGDPTIMGQSLFSSRATQALALFV
ncbi:hypothetical protein ACIQY5_03735 [Peribacillus frigoritolerans]|uniref:hypothetical protein n=1 Tax=Peribacillus frigoritolerans TaxID=450367 RepID=UPI0038106DDF